MAMNSEVSEILSSMGIKGIEKSAQQVLAESEKERVHPRIAKMLRADGIIFEEEDIVGGPEGSNTPLDTPGSAPLYDQNRQGQQPPSQQRESGIQLKDDSEEGQGIQLDQSSGKLETIDDLGAKMGEISETMRLIDLTVQTLKGNAKDTSLAKHKNRFRDDVDQLHRLITNLRNALR